MQLSYIHCILDMLLHDILIAMWMVLPKPGTASTVLSGPSWEHTRNGPTLDTFDLSISGCHGMHHP